MDTIDKLLAKPYIQNSSDKIQEKLKFLATKAPGYIANLLERPETFPGGKILAITNIYFDPEKSIFGIITYFDVMNDAGKKFNYQYFGWKQGPNSGTKSLIVFVNEIEGKMRCTHIGFIEKFKFAPGKVMLDLAGGFSESGEITDETLRRELEEELGITAEDIVESILLGRVMTDAGITNNHPNIAVVLVKPKNREKFESHVDTDQDTFQGTFKVYPWEVLPTLIATNDDGLFLAAIARAQIALHNYIP